MYDTRKKRDKENNISPISTDEEAAGSRGGAVSRVGTTTTPRFNKKQCFKCKRKRWVTEFRETCAAEFGRTAVCLFCIISDDQGKLKKSVADLEGKFKVEIEDLKQSLSQQLKALRDEVAGRGQTAQETSASPVRDILGTIEKTQRTLADSLNKEVETREKALRGLRKQVEDAVSGLRMEIGHHQTSTESRAVAQAVGSLNEERIDGNILDCERFLEHCERRLSQVGLLGRTAKDAGAAPKQPSMDNPELSVMSVKEVQSSPKVDTPPTTDSSKREKRKRKRRRRRKSRKLADRVDGTTGRSPEPPVNLLLGDSLVGWATGYTFSNLEESNAYKSLPGATIRDITREVERLNVHRDSTLILSCGGNDLFRKDGSSGNTESILEGYSTLIQTSKTKANRVIIVGIVPRRGKTVVHYAKATAINDRLQKMCQAFSVRFVDIWKSFFRNDHMYAADGTHFSREGAVAFAKLVNSKQFRPLREQTSAVVTRGRPETAGERATEGGKGVRRQRTHPAFQQVCPKKVTTKKFRDVAVQTEVVAEARLTSPGACTREKRSRDSSRGESVSPSQVVPAKRLKGVGEDGYDEDDVVVLEPRSSSPSSENQLPKDPAASSGENPPPPPFGHEPSPPPSDQGDDADDSNYDTTREDDPQGPGNV